MGTAISLHGALTVRQRCPRSGLNTCVAAHNGVISGSVGHQLPRFDAGVLLVQGQARLVVEMREMVDDAPLCGRPMAACVHIRGRDQHLAPGCTRMGYDPATRESDTMATTANLTDPQSRKTIPSLRDWESMSAGCQRPGTSRQPPLGAAEDLSGVLGEALFWVGAGG